MKSDITLVIAILGFIGGIGLWALNRFENGAVSGQRMKTAEGDIVKNQASILIFSEFKTRTETRADNWDAAIKRIEERQERMKEKQDEDRGEAKARRQ